MSSEPQIPENRAASDRLLRRKRQVLIAMVFLGVPAGLLLPVRYVPGSLSALLVGGVLLMGYLDFMRVVTFRRDLQERDQRLERD